MEYDSFSSFLLCTHLSSQGFIKDFHQVGGQKRQLQNKGGGGVRTIVILWYFYEHVCENMLLWLLLEIWHNGFTACSVCQV